MVDSAGSEGLDGLAVAAEKETVAAEKETAAVVMGTVAVVKETVTKAALFWVMEAGREYVGCDYEDHVGHVGCDYVGHDHVGCDHVGYDHVEYDHAGCDHVGCGHVGCVCLCFLVCANVVLRGLGLVDSIFSRRYKYSCWIDIHLSNYNRHVVICNLYHPYNISLHLDATLGRPNLKGTRFLLRAPEGKSTRVCVSLAL